MDNLHEIEKKQKEWEDTTLKEALKKYPERETPSDLPKQRLYTPKDLADFDYLRDLNFPGEYPYTRGCYPTMYRSRLWSIAQYSGFGTPRDTNKLFKFLLAQGQNGVSLACDLPTQLGYDSDSPMAKDDVGGIGVACPSLKEVEIIFAGIPMDKIRILGSTSHPHMILWSMYIAAAEKMGISSDKLSGTVVSDYMTEYIARGNYILPPKAAERVSLDFMEFGLKHIPNLSYMVVDAYSIREAGCTLVQEGAFALAIAIAFIEAALERGLNIDDFAPRLSFNSAIHMNFFEEIAKFRALRRLWARLLKERFGARKPASLWFRVGPGTGGSTLTAQQAKNNIARVTLEALAAILGGVQYLHTSSFDEGHGIPTKEAAIIALRTQQILAYESGVTDVVDPLGGSYYVEMLTNKIEREIMDYVNEIEARGGIIRATELGWVQEEITRSAFKKQREIEENKRIIVGVNKFTSDEKVDFKIHRREPKVAREMKRRLEKLRRERDNNAVQRCLVEIGKAAKGKDNLTPPVLDAVRNYATIGEICGVLRSVFGEYQEPALAIYR